MSSLFGYFSLGLRALDAAQLGLQVAGNNIANASTPGYAKRRVDLTSGYPTLVKGGMLDQGVDVAGIRRIEDRFLQVSLEREKGTLGYSREQLRGLQEIELNFGTLDGEGIVSAYGRFSDSFSELAGQPENLALRRTAISAADGLARQIRDTYDRLSDQQRAENGTVDAVASEVNQLAADLAQLNVEIQGAEAGRGQAPPLRDQRDQVIERLVELTGGTASASENGKIAFALPGGPTLVTSEHAIPLQLSRNASGLTQIAAGNGIDVTAKLRSGELGALLSLRDDSIPDRLNDLDSLASDLITRANLLTSATLDLDGAPGTPLFQPNPSPSSGAAGLISVSLTVLDDPRKLAISGSGAPGDGAGALELSYLQITTSGALGWKTPEDFFNDGLTALGNDIVQADVAGSVSADVLGTLEARKESISGVSLDEEAVELIRNQRAYQAAARFISVINEVTEIAVNIA